MKPAHAAIRHAARRRPAGARGFSLLEVVVVILLVLAMAALALPMTASWFSDAADEQTLDSIILAIRDQQREAMLARTPRAVWIGQGGVDAGEMATRVASSSRSELSTGASSRWALGGEPLMATTQADAPTNEMSTEGPSRRAAFELPKGWSFAIETVSSGAIAAAERPPVEPSGGDGTDGLARLVIFWPGGQVDVLGTLLVQSDDGHAWSVAIDPWTGVPAWRIRAATADQARIGGQSPSPSLPEASP